MYNGKELKEANGADYPPGAPKSMLVWDKNHTIYHIREVIGFINGRWAAVDGVKGAGTCDWDYAAEIPTAKVRPFESAEELDKAIAEHGSFIRNVDTGVRIIIDAYNSKEVRVLGMERPMEELFKNYTFADGTPFGVEEDA